MSRVRLLSTICPGSYAPGIARCRQESCKLREALPQLIGERYLLRQLWGLLLVAGDPLQDLSVLKGPIGVMVRGRWLTRERLNELLKPLAGDE